LGPRIVPALSCIVVYSMYLDELRACALPLDRPL